MVGGLGVGGGCGVNKDRVVCGGGHVFGLLIQLKVYLINLACTSVCVV